MSIIDKFPYISRLRYVHPVEKMALSLLTLIFCIVSRSILLGGIVLVMNYYLNVQLAGLEGKRYMRLMRIPLVFVILSTITILVNFSPKPLDAFAIPMGSIYFTASWAGVQRAAQLCITALAAVSCLYYFSLNTTITDMAQAYRYVHMPELFIELTILTHHYIFLLWDDGKSIQNSQKARLGNRDFKTSMRSFGAMLSAVFVRSIKRSNKLYKAMEARGYDGVINSIPEYQPLNKGRLAKILVLEGGMLAYTIAFNILEPGGFW